MQQDNAIKDISNKENHNIDRTSNLEMIMIKHSLSTCHTEEEEEEDDGIIIDISSASLPWYRSHALWSNMMTKTFDETYKCHSNFLDAHPAITAKMRSVLCDWLIEVEIEFSFVWIFFVNKNEHFRFVKFIIFIEKHII